ncbi:MAG: hypothetical protein P8Y70_20215 [Candidatus Lokiarchaeota archaeon]
MKGYKSDNKYGASSTIICGGFLLIFGYMNSLDGFLPYPYIIPIKNIKNASKKKNNVKVVL